NQLINYFIRSKCLILFSSALWTSPNWVNARLRFLLFLVRIWLLNACFLLIFPVAVTLNRFLALEFVFCLGMFLNLIIQFRFEYFYGDETVCFVFIISFWEL